MPPSYCDFMYHHVSPPLLFLFVSVLICSLSHYHPFQLLTVSVLLAPLPLPEHSPTTSLFLCESIKTLFTVIFIFSFSPPLPWFELSARQEEHQGQPQWLLLVHLPITSYIHLCRKIACRHGLEEARCNTGNTLCIMCGCILLSFKTN